MRPVPASTDITSGLDAAIPRHGDTQITTPLLASEQAHHLWRVKRAMKPQGAERMVHLFLRNSPYICNETKEGIVIK